MILRLTEDDIRRLRGEQLVIAALEPDQALKTLPTLLARPEERRRVVAMLDEFLSQSDELSSDQRAIIKRIKSVLQPKHAAADSENLTLAT